MDINVYPLDDSLGGDMMKFCIREARTEIPEWYKNSESYIRSSSQYEKDKNMTMKKCMPIFDYLSTGLNLHTPSSFYAEGSYPNRKIISASLDSVIGISTHHVDQKQGIPISEEYEQSPYKIEFPYSIETPSGYSSVFIGHNEDKNFPLLFPSAIVETDKYRAPVNFPFFIRKDFEGKIEAGTLFMKVLFVKRDSVSINYCDPRQDSGRILQHRRMVEAFGAGFYKKLRLNKI